jgi:PAS domain S-box-containing protein
MIQTKELIESIVDKMEDGFALHKLIIDKNNKPVDYEFVAVNKAFENFIGYKADEIIGKKVSEVTPEIFKGKFNIIELYDNIILKGKYEKLNIYWERLKKWYSLAVFSPAENYFAVIIHDITSQKQILKTYKEKERRLTTLLSNLPGMVYRCANDKNWTMKFVSNGGYNLTGYKPEELINNQKVSYGSLIISENSKKLWQTIQECISNRSTYQFEYKIKTKDGRIKWVWENGYGVFSEIGELIELEGFIRDISERKLYEESLIKTEKEYRDLYNNAPIGYHELNKDGIVIKVNQTEADLLGYTKDEIIGTPIFKYVVGNEIAQEDFSKKISKKKEIEGFERVYRKKNGQTFYVHIEDRLVTNALGEVIGIRSTIQDISKQKEAEEKLKVYAEELHQLNLSKDKLFSIVAHDLRGPFHPMLAITDLLATELNELNDDQIKNFSLELNKQLKNQYELLENLLNWTRLQLGRMQFQPIKLRLNHIVDKVVHLLLSNAVKKNIKIENNVVPISLVADQNMLHSILQNLITNAIKFTNPGGIIKLYSEQKDGFVEITIEDNGVGISKDNIEKIFNIDGQITTKGTADEKGTGLGLLLIKEMIEKHSGEIRVESEEGKGSKFIFTIPKAE